MTITEPRTDHISAETHPDRVDAAPSPNGDHPEDDTQRVTVAVGPSSPESTRRSSIPKTGPSTRAPISAIDHVLIDAHPQDVDGGPVSPATMQDPTFMGAASPGIPDSGNGQTHPDAHWVSAGVASTSPPVAITCPAPNDEAPLVEKPLAVIAELVNDLEGLRKANVNRIEVLTRVGTDKDGKERGWGLPKDHPAVLAVQALVDGLWEVEKQAVRELERTLKKSPLGPWVVAQHGLGPKTIARLLAATGDPYWNDLHDRPRTVSELWAYCGYRPGLKRRKGERDNWSADAKMRAHNLMDPIKKMLRSPCSSVKGDKGEYLYAVHVEGECACSPYRVLYDQARDKYRGSVHPEDCVRCGPSGHPALAGSPRSAAHQDAMAYRVVKKRILRDLWREAKRLHELPATKANADTQRVTVAGTSTPPLAMSTATPSRVTLAEV